MKRARLRSEVWLLTVQILRGENPAVVCSTEEEAAELMAEVQRVLRDLPLYEGTT